MFWRNIKTSFRFLLRNKLFSFINILGLALGLACFSLIMLHVMDDFSYDRFIPEEDRTYRMVLERIYPENRISYAIIPDSYKEVLLKDFPGIEASVRLMKIPGEVVFSYGDKSFPEKKVLFCDPSIFAFFSIEMIEGDAESALANPTSVVLSESTAIRYFGQTDVVGKILTTPFNELIITGVCRDMPPNSHIEYDIIGSSLILGWNARPNYTAFSAYTYLRLREGYEPADIEMKFPEMVKKYAAGQIEANMGIPYEDYVAAGNGYNYYLQPLKKIHLYSHLESEIRQNGNALYTFLFILIACFILVVAAINFVNLSTASSTDRAREVGIRKTSGAEKSQLVRQFILDALVISAVSLLVSLVLIELLLPGFNLFTGKTLEMKYFGSHYTIPVLAGVALLAGFLAGIYPAFVLSGFQPVTVMKGRFSRSRLGSSLRNVLVVFQFAISIALITITLLVNRQMDYVMQKDLGFVRKNVILMERLGFDRGRAESFRNEVTNLPDVRAAALSGTEISGGYYFGVMFQAGSRNSEILTSRGMVVDDRFIPALGLEITRGRGFSPDFNDSLSLVLNESAVQEFGLADPVGSRLFLTDNVNGGTMEMTVVGVIRDYHYNSLHNEIASFVLFSHTGPFPGSNFLSVVISPGAEQEALDQLRSVWQSFNPGQPFNARFLADELDRLYTNEKKSGQLFTSFMILAVLIACIGLFGLAVYTSRTRTREIGIRRVHGSSVYQIILLLMKDYALLVVYAFAIALPFSYFFIRGWLQNFSYRAGISPWIFLVSGLLALMVAMITISLQSWKTAVSNPVESLRVE